MPPAGRASPTTGNHVWRQKEVYSFLTTHVRFVRSFLTELPAQFEVAEGPVRLDAVLIVAEGGRATSIEAFEVVLLSELTTASPRRQCSSSLDMG